MTESPTELMVKLKKRTLGQVLRERRRQLNLTQQSVARRIRTSTPYIGHLEANKRRPSIVVINRLAEVLGLDRRDLFVLANPGVVDMLASNENDGRKSTWDEFRTAAQFQRAHQVTAEEMKLLAMVATMGDVGSPRDFIFILIAVRHVLDR
jgi:transcriptional regulator with XRE-family HTH domain